MLQPIQSMRLYRFVTSGQQPLSTLMVPLNGRGFFSHHGWETPCYPPSRIPFKPSVSEEVFRHNFNFNWIIQFNVSFMDLDSTGCELFALGSWMTHSTLWSRNLFCGSNMNGDIQTGRATVFFPEYPFNSGFFLPFWFSKLHQNVSSWHFENCTGPV